MAQNTWTWSVEKRIPSSAAAGKQFQEEVLERLADLDWTETEIFGVRMALEEAVVNAMRHGNRFDDTKSVSINCKLSPATVRIEISDEGPGFQPDCVPDCTCEDNLEIPSGRGIMLMRAFMSRVEFNEAGNGVIMEKDRAEPAASEE